jgi:HAD superfamily hydrolase (TIGR01484 family)
VTKPKVVYVDVDGTLVGPGGSLLWNGSTRIVEALIAAAAAGIDVVPVTGRGRIQVRELCRLLGLARGIGELGCVHVEGHEVRYEFGDFPFTGVTPVEAMEREGALDLALSLGLEPHDPWNEGREATFLLRGSVEEAAADAALDAAGFTWCRIVDNGVLRRLGMHAYHLVPTGTGKAFGVRIDLAAHGLTAADAVYVGDSASDAACAPEVGTCWLVANAEPSLVGPRTSSSYSDGVAEVIESVLSSSSSSPSSTS